MIAPGILLAAGTVGLFLGRHGLYLPAVAGVVVCLVLPGISKGWIARREARFPQGIDFVRDSDPSNLSSQGEWEHAAQSTVTSISHWTLGLAIGAIVVASLLELHRRIGRDAIVVEPPPETSGGAPVAAP